MSFVFMFVFVREVGFRNSSRNFINTFKLLP